MTANLDEEFGVWLRVALPGFSAEDLDSRLTGIRTFAERVNISDVVPLVLVFFGVLQDGKLPERLRDVLAKSVGHIASNSEAEMSILSGGVLFDLLELGGPRASASALALACAEFGRLGGSPRLQGVISRGLRFLAEEGLRIREMEIELPNLRASLLVPSNSLEREEDESGAVEEVSAVTLEQIVEALGDYGTALNRVVRNIDDRRREESNILFWLLSARRGANGQPLGELKRQDAVFDIAFELAEYTELIPGPAVSSAILRTLLDRCKNTAKESNVDACIDAVPAVDGERFLSRSRSYDARLMPMTFALEKARENGWQKGWRAAFQAQTGMEPSAERPLLQVAEQFYRELLLARLLQNG